MDIPLHNEMKQITCVLYKGGGTDVLQALHRRGINRCAMWHARGSAVGDPVGRNGLPVPFEKEIICVIVPAKSADEIFHFIFETAQIDRPYGGFLYMEQLKYASPYFFENVPEEDRS